MIHIEFKHILLKITFRNSVLALKAISLKGILPRSTKIRPIGTEPSVQNETKTFQAARRSSRKHLSVKNHVLALHHVEPKFLKILRSGLVKWRILN